MPEQPRSERKTQNRVIELFTGLDGIGYRYLGEWNKREKTCALKHGMMKELLTEKTWLV